jgi:Ran GTPase-activating protein (RanGAP) involved in mRNA processing and transport
MDIENIEVLDFSRNYLSSKGIFPFLKILQYFTNLRILILKNNGLNNECVIELCKVLKELSLVNLDLSGNKISKSVVPSIVELTDSNKYLIVDVENTRIEKNSFKK